MAHPYRILDAGEGISGPLRRLPVGRRRQHLAHRRRQRLRRQWPHELPTTLSHNAIGHLPLVASSRHGHQWDPGQQCFGHDAVTTPAHHHVGVRKQFVLATESDHRPGRHRCSRVRSAVRPRPAILLAGTPPVSGSPTPTRPGRGHPLSRWMVRRARPGRCPAEYPAATSWARSAADRPPRPRRASRAAVPPVRAASRSGVAVGPGSVAGKPIAARAAARWRTP